MGGRGGAGVSSARRSFKLPEFLGSEKQTAWAKEIAEGAFKGVELMQKNIDRFVAQGFRDDGSDAAQGYTSREVKEVRKFLESAFEEPTMKAAKNVIGKRSLFTQEYLKKIAQGVYKAGQKWDPKKKNWVKR